MKMAEYDWELKENRANQRVLQLLENLTIDVVDYHLPAKEFNQLQFEIFDAVRERSLSYVTCREAVEYGIKLLMVFDGVGVNKFFDTIQRVRMLMFDNIHPKEVLNDINHNLQCDIAAKMLIMETIHQFMKVFALQEDDGGIMFL